MKAAAVRTAAAECLDPMRIGEEAARLGSGLGLLDVSYV